MEIDLFDILKWIAIAAAGLTNIALPILFIALAAGAGSFLRRTQKEKYENVRDLAKKVKAVFTINIFSSIIAVVLLYFMFDKKYAYIQAGFFVLLIIMGIFAFGREKKAAQLYRNLFPPVPTSNAYKNGGTKSAASKPKADLPAAAVTSDDDWDKLFGGNNNSEKAGEVNQNLDIAKAADRELLEYVDEEPKNGTSEEDKVNLDLDIRKAPDRELMQYLEGSDTRTAPTVPTQNKEAGKGDGLNICPECGYLNFEGNTECDFCGAALKTG
ncbi:MAG: hypothetical protein K2N36_08775 [Ruminiclostridium sp.]|nr:hypothetical protein [Ruminiclostridium sp.]